MCESEVNRVPFYVPRTRVITPRCLVTFKQIMLVCGGVRALHLCISPIFYHYKIKVL